MSIGAFEHFGFDRYDDFFKTAYHVLPDDGVMLLHTITGLTFPEMAERGIPLTFEAARFVKFILTEIFPGGRLPSIQKVEEHAAQAGFTLTRRQSLQLHYARTLDTWAAALEAHRGRGHRDPVRRGLRALHAVPHRLRQGLPRRLHRRQPVHLGEVASSRVAFPGSHRRHREGGRSTRGRRRWGARRDEAIAVQSEEVYDRYMKYLTGCADMSRKGYIDVNQYALQT